MIHRCSVVSLRAARGKAREKNDRLGETHAVIHMILHP